MNVTGLAVQVMLILSVSACSDSNTGAVETDMPEETSAQTGGEIMRAQQERSSPPDSAQDPSKAFGPDIAGLQLGMSIDEVRRIIEGSGKSFDIKTRDFVIKINAGGISRTFDEYTQVLQAILSTPEEATTFEDITVNFSRPPNKARAIRIARRVNYGAAPTFDSFLALITEKYGAPDNRLATSRAQNFTGNWQIPLGKRDCSDELNQLGLPRTLDCNAQLRFRFAGGTSSGLVGRVYSVLGDLSFAAQERADNTIYTKELTDQLIQEGLANAPEPEL